MKLAAATGLIVLGLTGPALADFGVRPTRDDFQPAVSTQDKPPEGGRRYPPPNTATLLKKESRTPYDGPVTYRGGSNAPIPRDGSTNPGNKPPSQVGR